MRLLRRNRTLTRFFALNRCLLIQRCLELIRPNQINPMKPISRLCAAVFAILSLTTGAQEQSVDSRAELETQLAMATGCPSVLPLEVEMPQLDAADQALVREALNLDGAQRFPVCAYYARSNSNRNKDWIEQYIPTDEVADDPKDQDQVGWSLISIEGLQPTERDLAKYEHRGGTLYPESELDGIIDFEELRVVERGADRIVFETRPTRASLEKNRAELLHEHLETTLVIDTATRRVDFLTTKLDGEVKPNPFIKIHDFNQSINYEFVPEVGEVIMTELNMRADVKFVVIRRNFHLSATIFDFSCPAILQPVSCPEPAPRELE